MKLALVLAAPFPLHQGSQVFVAEQARALGNGGADVTVVCYAGGSGQPDGALRLVRTRPAWTPRTLRSSASPVKLVADANLGHALVRAHRRHGFDAILAHNSEAAATALLARPWLGAVPIIYVVHTLLRHELSAYGPRALSGLLDAVGGRLERAIARRADAVVTLCPAASEALAPHARGPLACIPPGLDPAPAPDDATIDAACRRFGLQRDGFALYTGNVDRYQDLERLDDAAARIPEVPVVVATHDATGAEFEALRVVEAPDRETLRALTFGCGVAALPRTRPGGFPIKLLNYLEAARAVVACEGVAPGLVHGRDAWLLPAGSLADAWAEAIATLLSDPPRRSALGSAGRQRLEREHAWPALAGRTLDLIQTLEIMKVSGQ